MAIFIQTNIFNGNNIFHFSAPHISISTPAAFLGRLLCNPFPVKYSSDSSQDVSLSRAQPMFWWMDLDIFCVFYWLWRSECNELVDCAEATAEWTVVEYQTIIYFPWHVFTCLFPKGGFTCNFPTLWSHSICPDLWRQRVACNLRFSTLLLEIGSDPIHNPPTRRWYKWTRCKCCRNIFFKSAFYTVFRKLLEIFIFFICLPMIILTSVVFICRLRARLY